MEQFGIFNGKPVELIRLQNGGLSAEILTYGATLRSLKVPDRDGKPLDVVLGFDSIEDYVNQSCYIGATVGPNANRIGGAACPIGKTRRRLDANDGKNNLHSGFSGLDRELWEVLAVSEEAVTLLCTHPDGRGGLPGDLNLAVTYWLEDGGLLVDYRAFSERDSLCNPTNHSYFNLDGQGSGDVLEHRVQILSETFTPTDAQSIPTGELRPVAGTVMDLREPVRIGDRVEDPEPQLRLAKGFDHNWILEEKEEEPFRLAARVWGARSGLCMELWTDRPGVQFYSGNYIPQGLPGKDGALYGPRAGLCLETQAWPDAPNHPNFPSTLLRAGKEWQSRSLYRFRTE
ncbi:MAG: galactose mutarotase [Oscillospiraceae bacterium]|nr:galactose mutarotase [Oscillospiraceae bacterium]